MKNKIQHIIAAIVFTLGGHYIANAQVTAQKIGANPTSISPSAVLDIESSNKGVLFPRVTLTSTSDITTIATPASGLTVFNTASAGTSPSNVTPGYYYWNGSKWVKMAIETPFAKTVYVNATSPTTATIFDENNPPATNDNALKADDVNLYIGNNGSTWTYNTSTSTYNTFIVPASTPFNLAGTTTDAGSNKTAAIERTGSASVTNGFLRASGNSNSFTIDPTQGGGPRLMLGTTAAPNSYFELGAYNSMNNFDTKGRDFNIFSAARANALFLESDNGNIGIGTNTPLTTLHVHNPTAATNTINADAQVLRFSRPRGSRLTENVAQFNLGSYTAGGYAHSRLDIALNNATDLTLTTAMTLQGDGNVGIGTTAPTQRLDVNGTGLFRRGNGGTGGSANQILFSHNGSNEWVHAIKTRHNGGGIQGNAIDFYAYSFTTNGNTNPTGIGSQHLMSLEVGRVGIGGITGPQSVIDAASTGVATATVNASRKMLRLSIPTAEGTKTGNVAEFNMGSYGVLGANARTRLDLLLNDGLDNAVSQVMTWQANGNVGIGTAAPLTKLVVNDNAYIANLPTTTANLQDNSTFRPLTRFQTSSGLNNNAISHYLTTTAAATQAHNYSTGEVLPYSLQPAGGNVGIGTTAPASRLDVSTGVTTTNSIVNATGSINDYLQFNIQNTSTGTQAQSGYSATANNGSATTGFAWLGINNSNFNFPTSYNIGGANDVSFIGSGQDLYIANANNTKSIIFSTGKATTPFFNEQMRILNNGNVGIGTTAPTQRLHIKGTNAQPATTGTVSNATLRIDGNSSHGLDIGTFANSPYGSYLQSVTTTDLTLKLPLVLNPTGGNVGIGIDNPSYALHVNGDINASGSVRANTVALTSDARLKTKVVEISNGLSKIMELRPVNYDKKVALDNPTTVNENGFIAQELQKVMPELVSEGNDKDKLLSVNYTAIIPVLTKAVQEQQKTIEQNQATIQKQQEQINELKLLLEKVLNKK